MWKGRGHAQRQSSSRTDLSTTDVTKAANFVTLVDASSDMFEVQSSKIGQLPSALNSTTG